MHVWNRLQRIKSVKMVVETSDKNQYSYFYIVNSFLKKSRKNNEVGLGCRVWGRAPAGGRGALVHQLSLSMLAFASYIKKIRKLSSFSHLIKLIMDICNGNGIQKKASSSAESVTCAAAKGNLPSLSSRRFLKLTKIPCAVSGLR